MESEKEREGECERESERERETNRKGVRYKEIEKVSERN